MRLLSHLRLRTKLALLAGLSALILVLALLDGAAVLRDRAIDDRVDKLRAVTKGAADYAAALEAQVKDGRLSPQGARAAMAGYVHAMRFDGGEGYLTVSSMDGVILFHGVDPNRENKPTTAKDESGHTLPELVAQLLGTGVNEGVIAYSFPKPGQTKPLPKLAYVVRFAPWQAYMLAGAYTDDLEADLAATLLRQGVIGGLLLLVMVLVAYLVNRDIAGSLGRLQISMGRLAAGDLTQRVPGLDRRDEAGAMAKAVEVFRQTMMEAERLRAEQESIKQEAAAAQIRARAALADRFGEGVGKVVHSVATAVGDLQTTARSLAETSQRTTEQAVTVASASEQATQNVQTVASAAEQLAASIREISQLVSRAGGMIEEGVRQTLRSN